MVFTHIIQQIQMLDLILLTLLAIDLLIITMGFTRQIQVALMDIPTTSKIIYSRVALGMESTVTITRGNG